MAENCVLGGTLHARVTCESDNMSLSGFTFARYQIATVIATVPCVTHAVTLGGLVLTITSSF